MADIHVLPIRDLVDHDETRECWCGPRLEQPCPECDGDDAACWLCAGEGAVPVLDEDRDCVVIHNAIDGRE